jgi:ribosomal RNA-processing protein 9
MQKLKKRESYDKGEQEEKRPRLKYDEEISSSDEEGDFEVDPDNLFQVSTDSEGEENGEKSDDIEEEKQEVVKESIDEMRVRQATTMLDKIKQLVGDQTQEEKQDSKDPILMKLRAEERRATTSVPPRFEKNLEKMIYTDDNMHFIRGHKKSPTCICLSPDDRYVFTGGKDGCIIKWNLSNSSKIITKGAHKGHILSIAISSDGKYLVTGGRDKKIRVWDPETDKILETFETAHSGDVNALSFQMGTHTLFSGSTDRVIKVWDLDEMAYAESLYGHEGPIYALDSMFQYSTVSTGEDRSVRYWKVEEESQLVLKGQKESIDCMSMFNDTTYFTGSQDGSIALWNRLRKKPQHIFQNAHGGKWVTAAATFKFSKIGATGSSDGYLKLWNCGNNIQLMTQVPVNGYVNGITFSKDGKFIVAAIGQEHRLGRWNPLKVKNGIAVYKF